MSGNKQDFLSDINRFQANHEFKHIKAGGGSFRYILCGEGKNAAARAAAGFPARRNDRSIVSYIEA